MKNASMARYRWLVASRVLAAALGGYALTSALTVLLSLVWPLPKSQAVLSATMLSFTLYAVAVIWVFSVRSVTRAWLGMVIPTAVIALLCWVLQSGGAA
ncbi:DUF3649 domain-containing protein [Pseudomonas seleniipraecipitans]|uniref:DUF3649 domain-containing protein n=1 Tax=Phytopseudomonas seleniipraecipitans TaxID=640205 RepID=A0ABY5J2M5_9GAMM|nr:DUF3649 domain-containing protein [Pseudomonas seleniipraecipitans]UUD62329.1 DUF3649 domain-containing protein [Pseudomonas seleniipraecipitans]